MSYSTQALCWLALWIVFGLALRRVLNRREER
jgi:hypothetical protein